MIYANGIHDFATAYRVDGPERERGKQWICGTCISEQEATDPGTFAGHYKCESCGQSFGESNAYERADELLARICPVAARKRQAKLTTNDQ